MTVRIKDLPLEERPYEKLINNGVASLTNEELLAIIIRSGTKNSSAKEVAARILKEINNISQLSNINYATISKIKGIGIKKSCTLLASIELGLRIINYKPSIINKKFNNPGIVYEYYRSKLYDKKQEYFYVIYLDNAKKIIKEKLLFIGTINYSIVHPREIFKEAYLCSSSSIICLHNHPSGNIIPSKEDIEITKNIYNVGLILGIKLIDHIIIGTDNYYSFLENNDI
jgi:DNA repair protein RadC